MDADFRVGKWQVFIRLNTLTSDAESVRIEPKVMEVLALLAKHKGEVVSKDEIIRQVWSDTFVTDEVLWRCISELRRILGDDDRCPQFIQTVPKRGYRLIAPAEPPERCPCIRLRRSGTMIPAEIIGSIAVLPFVDMTQEKDQLVFHQLNGQYFLACVRSSSSSLSGTLFPSRHERELLAQGGKPVAVELLGTAR